MTNEAVARSGAQNSGFSESLSPGQALAQGMGEILQRSWWFVLIRGLAALVFGLLSFANPAVSLATLVLFAGCYLLVDGAIGVWLGLSSRKRNDDWWVLLLWGLAGIAAGLLTFSAPGLTALALLFYIAAWAVVTGVLQIIAAVRLRKEISGEWLMGLAGVLSVGFGLFLMARPGEGALAVVLVIASYALVLGLILLVLAFKLRGLGRKLSPSK